MTDPAFELYYGGPDNMVHELIYHFKTNEWTSHATFMDSNGNGGIACSASNTSFSYMFASSKENTLELWWKDSNDTAANRAANTSTHPLGVWTKGISFRSIGGNPLTSLIFYSVLNPAPITLYPNSSISRIRISDTNNLIFFLTPSNTISALQPSLAAENSTWGSPLEVGPGAYPGMGSQLSTGTIFQGNYSVRSNMTDRELRANLAFQVFFQEGERGGLKQFMRRYEGGQWTSTNVLEQ